MSISFGLQSVTSVTSVIAKVEIETMDHDDQPEIRPLPASPRCRMNLSKKSAGQGTPQFSERHFRMKTFGVSFNLVVTNSPNDPDTSFNDVIAKSLIVSLDLGLTYIDIAETSQYEETASRNRGHARKSYTRAVDALEKLSFLDSGHRQTLEAKLAMLQARLTTIS